MNPMSALPIPDSTLLPAWHILPLLLQAAGVGQLLIAAMNLGLVRMMGWKGQLERLDLLPRQVFQVHIWFISLTLAIFGVLTLRFTAEMMGDEVALAKWLAAAIGIFWGVRAVLQLTYYSPNHWRGDLKKTIGHVACLALYGGMALVYLLAVVW